MHPDLFHLANGPAEFVVTGLWQGLLITGAAWMGLRALPKLAPRTRFLLWMAVFLLAALLPFAGLLAQPGSASFSAHTGKIPAAHLGAGWALALAGLWVLASLFALARLAAQGYELHRLARSSAALPPESLPLELRSLLEHGMLEHGKRKHGSRPVALRLSKHLDSPIAMGFFHPAIVVPEWLWKRLTPSELNQVVMHEIAHLKRRDDWTNLLQKFFRALFPLNPALLWAERQLCREREMACDDAVLDAAVAPREYAASLASLAEKRLLRHAQSLAPSAWRRRSELAQRVHRILKGSGGQNAFSARLAVATFLAVFLSSGALLARSPRIVTFLPPSFPVALASTAAAPSLSLRSAPGERNTGLNGPPRARFEQASLRTIVLQTAVRKAKRQPDSAALRRRSLRRVELRALGPIDPIGLIGQRRFASSADAMQPEAMQPGIVLAVWEISPSLLSDSGFSYSSIAAFRSGEGWIIFQL